MFGRGLEESQIKGTAATQGPKSIGQIGDNLYSKEQVVKYKNVSRCLLILCLILKSS